MDVLNDIEVIFKQSAFDHNLTSGDILKALVEYQFYGIMEDEQGDLEKWLVLGFDLKGNMIEVMYNETGAKQITVFHAMKCRSVFYRLLENQE
jgi:hypothetical protein